MKVGEIFARAIAAITPVRTDKVVLPLQKVTRAINLTGPEYHPAPEVHEFTMMTCGIMPSVRNDMGFTRGFHANPKEFLTITPPRGQIAEQEQEAPWKLKSSPAILVHDHLISRWHRGLNVVVRGKMESLEKPNVLMAMQSRYDKDGNLTVKRLYLPTFDDYRRMSGLQRIPVTAENVARALTYMTLCREQMLDNG
ncbi:MAG: hypothetical protein KKA05_01165, partial [Alphaproteobacteria bacterium]|nr:hypothetical protein [Alphaproteobacteria bacterium]